MDPCLESITRAVSRLRCKCSDDAYLALSHGRVLGRVDGFAERKWNVGASKVRYSLIFAARMTLPHFSFSAAMNVPNSTGEVAKAVSPQSAIVNKISGCDIDLEPCRLRSGRMPWAGLGRRKTDDGKNPNRLAADRDDPWRAAVLMSSPRAVHQLWYCLGGFAVVANGKPPLMEP